MFDILDSMLTEDLTDIKWSLSVHGSGSNGVFYKAIINDTYYKLSSFNGLNGEYGYESVYEVMTSRVADLLGFNHCKYDLVHAKIKLGSKEMIVNLTKSKSFKNDYESRLTAEQYLGMNEVDVYDKEECLSYLLNSSFKEDICNMLVFDYIICNRDRHGANIEFLVIDESIRLAPIFDNGSSLFAPAFRDKDRIISFNKFYDGPINSFLGSMFYSDILNQIKGKCTVPYIDIDSLSFASFEKYFDKEDRYICKECENLVKERYKYILIYLGVF